MSAIKYNFENNRLAPCKPAILRMRFYLKLGKKRLERQSCDN